MLQTVREEDKMMIATMSPPKNVAEVTDGDRGHT